jgi:hypothetical protein
MKNCTGNAKTVGLNVISATRASRIPCKSWQSKAWECMSKARKLARGEMCTVRLDCCTGCYDTTVLAHLPCKHSGMGMKSPDSIAVFACASCHDVIDGRVKGEIDWKDILRSLAETHSIMIREGVMVVK